MTSAPSRRSLATLVAVGLVLAAVVLGVLVAGGNHATAPPAALTPAPASGQPADALSRSIGNEQAALRDDDRDWQAWANLGLDYVQQAKVTVNPAYYPKAVGALRRSLQLHRADNYVAMAGEAALSAAQHRFRAARRWALDGLRVDPSSAALYGALDDAQTQLGHYGAAFAAVRRMNALQPGVPAFTRAEYVYELRGRVAAAHAALVAALRQATSPSDKAFVYYYLGELAFTNGHARAALAAARAGLLADPTYAALLEGRAKAEAALGRTRAAVRDYLTVVSEVPQPEYVVEAGELLQSLGRTAQAKQEYALFATENRLFTSNGVTLDTDPTLFFANHGNAGTALRYGRTGLRIRPFIEMQDAYAWALHAAHHNRAALAYEHRAMALGTRNALFAFHAGMIQLSLGHRAEAAAMLRRALAINPFFNPLQAPVARATLRRLERP